jgi:poly(A) polymerase
MNDPHRSDALPDEGNPHQDSDVAEATPAKGAAEPRRSEHPPREHARGDRGQKRGHGRRDDAHRAPRRDHDGEHRASQNPLALDAPPPSPSHPPEIPEDQLDPDAVRVIARLRHVGHQAYFVGGCVRDLLLGKTPKDFDLATSAHPGEVRATFRNCRLIGRRFRLAHVYFRGGKVLEVATFRKNPTDVAGDDAGDDADLLITRDNVFGTAEEDARRRDFTVNGLFYDVFAGEVIDYVGGRADLEAHRIATIGDPEIRMQEDPVRALRAIRFASRLGFTIEPETFAAMRRHGPELARCAPPRLLEETFKILRCGASARAFELLRTSGALPVLLPALASFYDRAPEDGRRRFLAHLQALDALVRGGGDPSEAVLLGALLLHLPAGEPGAHPNERDALLAELVATARLPRRIAERTRLALSSQRTFRGQARRRKRGITSQAYFTDALQLLEITVEATGEGMDLLERWRAEPHPHHEHQEDHRHERHGAEASREISVERGSDQGPPRAEPGDAAPASASAEGEGRRRRRRRGGRRRRRRGGGAGTAPHTPEAPRS